jgi:hypothetical protein
LAQTPQPALVTVPRAGCVPRGWAQPESEAVELFMDRLPDRYVGFGDMDLNVAGTPGEASGDLKCPVPERQATPERTGRCSHERAGGMEAVWRRFAVSRSKRRRASSTAKPGAGCSVSWAAFPNRRASCGWRATRWPQARRVLALSVALVVLDHIQNDLVVSAEVVMDGAIAHRSHRPPFDLGGGSAPHSSGTFFAASPLTSRLRANPRWCAPFVTKSVGVGRALVARRS